MVAIQNSCPAALRAGLLIGLATLTACVADQQTGTRNAETSPGPLGFATFDCGADGTISLEARQGSVTLTDTDGSSYDLPASPPAQSQRFGGDGAALLVDGSEALWMKSGKLPLSCRR